jgi:hypothetical protein
MGSFSIWHLLIIGVIIVALVFAFVQWQGSLGSSIVAEKYIPHYGGEKFVGGVTFFAGGVLLVLGIVGVIAGVLGASSLASEHPNLLQGLEFPRQAYLVAAVAGLGFSVLLVIIGLLMESVGNHLRVTTDAANRLGEILALMKSGVATPLPEPTTQVQQQVSTAKFCTGCGATVVGVESAFCAQCGAKL